ncbi:hypothetical protein, partial [Pseudomonas gingeri]
MYESKQINYLFWARLTEKSTAPAGCENHLSKIQQKLLGGCCWSSKGSVDLATLQGLIYPALAGARLAGD